MANVSRPAIIPAPNGPLILVDDPGPRRVEHLVGPGNEPYEKPVTVSLCRCGASNTKPFCDGTHGTIGFKSDKDPTGWPDQLQSFPGPEGVTVHFNRAICSGAGLCARTLPNAFLEHEVDWIRPENATPDELKRMIPNCPSGALSYSINGHRMPEPRGREPRVRVEPNGPFRVTGGIELMGVEFNQGASREHYTLCRCGRSKNKPFCDYSHAEGDSPWSDGSQLQNPNADPAKRSG